MPSHVAATFLVWIWGLIADCRRKVYAPAEESRSRIRLLFCSSSALEGDVACAFQHISYVHATIFYSSIYEEAVFLIADMKIFVLQGQFSRTG